MEDPEQDRYDVVRIIGRGAFATAYLAFDRQDGAHCVIKCYNVPWDELSEKERGEAENEVAVLQRLASDSVVAYRNAFIRDNVMHIVMEYADGGGLDSAIAGQQGVPFAEDMVWDWTVQLLHALCTCHDRRILHRDLKPPNILLAGRDRRIVKLADFGIARALSTLDNMAGTMVGTPYYLSPELCEGRLYDGKSDVWSLGCVLYEVLELHRAFEGPTFPALVLAIVRGQRREMRSEYSEALRAVVELMLEPDPEQRPSAAELCDLHQVQQRWHSWLARAPRYHEEARRLSVAAAAQLASSSGAGQLARPPGSMKLFQWGRGAPRPMSIEEEELARDHDILALAVSLSEGGHAAAVTADGRVLTWGEGDMGRLGQGDTRPRRHPTALDDLHTQAGRIRQVALGDTHSLFLSASGAVWLAGSHGEGGRVALRLTRRTDARTHYLRSRGSGRTPRGAAGSPRVAEPESTQGEEGAAGGRLRQVPEWARARAARLGIKATGEDEGTRPQANPFATGSGDGRSPLASGAESERNPFASGASPSASGGSGANPFASGASGASPSASRGSGANPFAGGAPAANPFASGAPAANPFAGGAESERNTFASGESIANPLASGDPATAKARSGQAGEESQHDCESAAADTPAGHSTGGQSQALSKPGSEGATGEAAPAPAPHEDDSSATQDLPHTSVNARGEGEGAEDSAAGEEEVAEEAGTEWVCVPARIAALGHVTVQFVACGQDSSAAVDSSGQLWTWGSNYAGCLGHGHEDDVLAPTVVSALAGEKRVKTVACGPDYMAAVLQGSGALWTWGSNESGQLGQGPDAEELVCSPSPAAGAARDARIVDVAAGAEHLVAATEEGTVLTVGSNDDGQLGHGAGHRSLRSPRVVAYLRDCDVVVTRVFCGAYHTLVMTSDEDLFAWGRGDTGQLGVGGRASVGEPRPLLLRRVAHVAAGHDVTLAATWRRIF